MKNGWSELLHQIAEFAEAVPLASVKEAADQIERVDVTHWAYARMKALESLGQPVTRDKLAKVLDTWHASAPDVSPQSVALAMMSAAEVENRRRGESAELVWTGPDSGAIPLRRTDQALLQVINAAQKKLLIVSFAVYRIPEIANALVIAAGRGVEIRICIESPDASEGRMAYDTIHALGQQVASCAAVYVWPLSKRLRSPDGKPGSLHVKCALADADLLFVSSANLTEYAMTLNMELGVLIRGGPLPGQVAAHFDRLIERGVLVAV